VMSTGEMNKKLVSNAEVASLSGRVNFASLSTRTILVTGASGMVAGYLVEALNDCCWALDLPAPQIFLTARSSGKGLSAKFANFPNVRLIDWELESLPKLNVLDFVVHAASPASPTAYADFASLSDANRGFLQRLMNLVEPQRVLFVSSGEVYGRDLPNPVSESHLSSSIPDGLRGYYPRAKLEAERWLFDWAENAGASASSIRLFHSFGPGVRKDDGRSFADFLWAGASKEPVFLRSDGSQIRTFLYLEDAVAGILTLLLEGESLKFYNLGGSKAQSVLEFAQLVASVAGVPLATQRKKDFKDFEYRPSELDVIVPSTVEITKLGWRQEIDTRTGIERTLKWIQALHRGVAHEH